MTISSAKGEYNHVHSSQSKCHTKREFSHLRLIILLATALNTLDFKSNFYQVTLKNFQHDLNYCEDCFKPQEDECANFFNDISKDNEQAIWQLVSVLPQRIWKRTNQMFTQKSTQERIIAKYFANSEEHLNWLPETKELRRIFLENERLNGMQYYPKENVMHLLTFLQTFHNGLKEKCFWLYLLVNSQLLTMPILYELQFPVPKPYRTCGFTFFQEYAGLDLYHFKGKQFAIKLNIAHQILKAAVKFSLGFENFRLYITDLTADNMVYDMTRKQLSFVDLDTLLIVDSTYAKYKSSIHKHEYIECPGCFAYAPDDISSYNMSDINIFTACQFLREDLNRDKSKGFLSPLPKDVEQIYPRFVELLDRCVDCPQLECWNRFAVVQDLINLIEITLNDINKT